LVEKPPLFLAGIWKVDKATDILAAKLSGGALEFYDSVNGFWLSCTLATKHSIKTDLYVILYCKGVTCENLSSILAQINYKA
jgi:hypothetical protein